MLNKVLGTFLLISYGLTVLAQVNNKIRKAPAIQPLFMAQGTLTKFFADQDASFSTSISAGIKYMNKFGITANVQATGLDEGYIYHLPVSLELSFTAEKNKIRPFANLQIGHVFSRSSYSITSGAIKITSETKGAAFFSPGIGVLFPVKKQSGILVTLSYLNSGSRTKTTAASPAEVVHVISKYYDGGYRIGVGFKF